MTKYVVVKRFNGTKWVVSDDLDNVPVDKYIYLVVTTDDVRNSDEVMTDPKGETDRKRLDEYVSNLEMEEYYRDYYR